MSLTSPETTAEANRLYWESEMAVAEIAEHLDISRRALYAAVEPLPAGRPCPACGTELVYENRSGRTADQTICLLCGAAADDEVDEPDTSDEEEDAAAASSGDAVSAQLEPAVPTPGVAALAGAAIGVVVGALVTFVLVPRR